MEAPLGSTTVEALAVLAENNDDHLYDLIKLTNISTFSTSLAPMYDICGFCASDQSSLGRPPLNALDLYDLYHL